MGMNFIYLQYVMLLLYCNFVFKQLFLLMRDNVILKDRIAFCLLNSGFCNAS
jgi:hypothetical protein